MFVNVGFNIKFVLEPEKSLIITMWKVIKLSYLQQIQTQSW